MGRSIRRLTAFVAISLALTACGDRFTPPAAVVNGHEISQEAVAEELRLLKLTKPQVAASIAGPRGAEQQRELTRLVLAYLIRYSLVQGYARTHGITVERADVDAALSVAIDQSGGPAAFEQALRARGLSLTDFRTVLAQDVLVQQVRLDVTATGGGEEVEPGPVFVEEEEDAFGRWLQGELAAATVRVNPRFGAFDPKSPTLVIPLESTQLLQG